MSNWWQRPRTGDGIAVAPVSYASGTRADREVLRSNAEDPIAVAKGRGVELAAAASKIGIARASS